MVDVIVNSWEIAEPLLGYSGAAVTLFFIVLLLMNPIWRNRFFGFNPTIILCVFDHSTKRVLVSHRKDGNVILPQGRIGASVVQSAKENLRKETGLDYQTKLLRRIALGRIFLWGEERLANETDSNEWRLFPALGKYYEVFLIATDETAAIKEIGEYRYFEYSQVSFCDLDEAMQLLQVNRREKKFRLYWRIMDAVNAFKVKPVE